jgi:Alpha/beta hydrolase
VTAPAGEPATLRLAAVAVWDVSPLRGAVATLDAVAGRLRAWRARLDGVGRSLTSGECWTGPSARAAGSVADELSSAAWAVDVAVAGSLAAFERLATEADLAQELAVRALALSAADEAPGASAPVPPNARTLGDDALVHAAAAAAAAYDASEVLVGVGVRNGWVPADLPRLATGADVHEPVLPTEGAPHEVAAWWTGLPATARLELIRRAPAAVGRLDGVPAWARDQANRLVLDRALDDPRTPWAAAHTARAVARQLRVEEKAGRQAQLQVLDLEGDRVVLALGDLDTADAVALLVPGKGATPSHDLRRMATDARAVASSARAAGPGLSVATVVWLGYRAPASWYQAVLRESASRGAPALADGLAGLAAARTATGDAAPRTTVLAHSYGTVVVDEAADLDGELAADAVVLSGSPGMEEDARSLEAPEVYDATAPDDWVANRSRFGSSPREAGYGSTGLPTDPEMGHSDYYSPEFRTLPAIGEVVAGTRKAA